MTALLIGYAIGTAQILAIDWFRPRIRHRSHLRVLRAELRRAGSYRQKVDIEDQQALERQTILRPPTVGPRFADFLTQTEFHLTDEHDDVPTQEALLGILDACQMFRTILDGFADGLNKLAQTTDPSRREQLAENLRGMARDYDRRLGEFMSVLDAVTEGLEHRLQNASTWRQLNRPIGHLPRQKSSPSRRGA